MGSSSERSRDPSSSTDGPAPRYSAPEFLARLVVRCRELETFLQAASGHLPKPEEAPFLSRQLEDVVGRLQHGLNALGLGDPHAADEEERGGFLRLFSSKKRKPQAAAYPTALASSKARYDLQGSAWTIPVTELVGFLSQSGKSGVLWVTTTSETFVLEFTRGSLVHATSNAPPRAFRLGEILIREEKIDRESLDREIAKARSSEEFLGSHLVRAGLITRENLQRALAIQVQELFHRLMDAENATYGFQDGLQLLRAQSLEVNITSLLLESARKKDETRFLAQGKPPPPPLSILEPDPEPEPVSAPVPKRQEPAATAEDSRPESSKPKDSTLGESTPREPAPETPTALASAAGTDEDAPVGRVEGWSQVGPARTETPTEKPPQSSAPEPRPEPSTEVSEPRAALPAQRMAAPVPAPEESARESAREQA